MKQIIKQILKYLCPVHYFKKKNEIIFHGKYRFVDKINPVVKSSDVGREWLKEAKKDFNAKLVDKKIRNLRSIHKCNGISSLMEMGLTIKNDEEFAVETNGDDIKIYVDEGEISPCHSTLRDPSIKFFDQSVLGNYNRPLGANPFVIKKITPWYLTAPKDIVFIMLPISYPDDNRFIATSGIFDPVMSTQLNVIFWWLVKEGYEVVKKGVPMAQLIPIPRSMQYSWKMTDEVPQKIYDYLEGQNKITGSTKCPFYSELKKFSNEIYDF